MGIPKEDLEAHLQKKYTDPLTDAPLRRLNEPNSPQPPEEKLDDSPLKVGEIKDLCAHWGLTAFHVSSTKDALKYYYYFGSFYEKLIQRNTPYIEGSNQELDR